MNIFLVGPVTAPDGIPAGQFSAAGKTARERCPRWVVLAAGRGACVAQSNPRESDLVPGAIPALPALYC